MKKHNLLLPAVLLLGLVAMPMMADEDARPPRPPRAPMRQQMSEPVKTALKAYRENPSDDNAAALKKAIAAETDARLKKYSDKIANRDREIDATFKRLTAAPKQRGNRVLTMEEAKKARELRQEIAKLDADSADAAAKVAELGALRKQAAARVEAALEQARKEGKETAGLENSLQMLKKQIAQTEDVAKCISECKRQKNGKDAAPRQHGKRKGKGKGKNADK